MIKLEGGFIQNLGRVYGIYTLGFLGFVILMAILEQAGVSSDAIGWMFVGFTILIYALIGVLSRTMQSSEYYVAAKQVIGQTGVTFRRCQQNGSRRPWIKSHTRPRMNGFMKTKRPARSKIALEHAGRFLIASCP